MTQFSLFLPSPLFFRAFLDFTVYELIENLITNDQDGVTDACDRDHETPDDGRHAQFTRNASTAQTNTIVTLTRRGWVLLPPVHQKDVEEEPPAKFIRFRHCRPLGLPAEGTGASRFLVNLQDMQRVLQRTSLLVVWSLLLLTCKYTLYPTSSAS